MSVFHSSVFCFIFSICVVTGQSLAAVIADPSNSAFQRANTSGPGVPSGSGHGDPCSSACRESLAPDWLENDASFRLDFGSTFSAIGLEPRHPTGVARFRIEIANVDNSTPMHPKAQDQDQDIFATVLFVDGVFGIEPIYPVANAQSPASGAVSSAFSIPLPSAMSLFLIGLVGLVFLTWRRGGRPSL